jgi:UDP-N-acetyl-D-glucosamine dehydrogenase
MSHILNVNIWEVIEAAATKPFGFMPFFPGPGLGGHCIPIDPHYLSWKAKQSGFEARFIELAGVVNGAMPHHVLTRINDALNEHSKCLKGSRILIVGVAYKKNVNDLRESPALDLMVLLEQKGVILEYTDPYISSFSLLGREFHSANIAPGVDLSRFDAAVVVTDHTNVDYLGLTQRLPVIVDTRNVFKGITNNKIFGL